MSDVTAFGAHYERLLELARSVAAAPIPERVQSMTEANELLVAHDALAEYLAEVDYAAWIESMPDDIRDVPAWHQRQPNANFSILLGAQTGAGRERAEGDAVVCVTDGFALARVPAGGREAKERDDDERLNMARVLDAKIPTIGCFGRADIDAWLSDAVELREDGVGGVVRAVQLGAAILDVALLRRWLWPCARLTDGPILVEGGGPHDAVRWSADGWTVMAMPGRFEVPEGATLPRLAVPHA